MEHANDDESNIERQRRHEIELCWVWNLFFVLCYPSSSSLFPTTQFSILHKTVEVAIVYTVYTEE